VTSWTAIISIRLPFSWAHFKCQLVVKRLGAPIPISPRKMQTLKKFPAFRLEDKFKKQEYFFQEIKRVLLSL